MNIGAVIAAKQDRYIRLFTDAGATKPETALSLHELDCRRSILFERLVDRGVFVQAADDRYYVDLTTAEAFRSHRRRVVSLALVAVAVVAGLLFLLGR